MERPSIDEALTKGHHPTSRTRRDSHVPGYCLFACGDQTLTAERALNFR